MDVIDELVDDEHRIDHAHVERRVRDWEDRVHALYGQLTSWLPDGWTASPSGAARLSEPLMERFGIPGRDLPGLSLFDQGTERARLEPRNLWIIGSNGRVDLSGSVGHFVLNDRSEIFDLPSWNIASFLDRLNEEPLTIDTFRQALR